MSNSMLPEPRSSGLRAFAREHPQLAEIGAGSAAAVFAFALGVGLIPGFAQRPQTILITAGVACIAGRLGARWLRSEWPDASSPASRQSFRTLYLTKAVRTLAIGLAAGVIGSLFSTGGPVDPVGLYSFLAAWSFAGAGLTWALAAGATLIPHRAHAL